MTKYVYVVTSTEMGWDCVCGVYETAESAYRSCFYDNPEGLTLQEMTEQVDSGDTVYIIHDKRLEA